jgi:DNA replication protein DnaC
MSSCDDRLSELLGKLKLFGIRDRLDSLLDEASRSDLDMRQTLTLLLEREIARKDARRIEMALKLAHFPMVRDLTGFDFAAQPSVDARQVRDLAAGRWIANGENVLLLGPPGVGKTHLAIALGREAILAGYAALFMPATALVAQLARAHVEGRLEDWLMHFAKPKRSWTNWATCRSSPLRRICSSSLSRAATKRERC